MSEIIEPTKKLPEPLEGETVVAYRKRTNPTLPEGLPEPRKGELVVDFRRRVINQRLMESQK